MSNRIQAPMGSAEAQQHFLNGQVNLFLFDLKNEAIEHGFKADESWALELASENEMLDLKRHHHPVVSVRLQPHALLNVYQQVKNKLQQSLSKVDAALTENDLTEDNKKHLAAYPMKKINK